MYEPTGLITELAVYSMGLAFLTAVLTANINAKSYCWPGLTAMLLPRWYLQNESAGSQDYSGPIFKLYFGLLKQGIARNRVLD